MLMRNWLNSWEQKQQRTRGLRRRKRARGRLGLMWPNAAEVLERRVMLAGTPITITFQDGVDGYDGTRDTRLRSGRPDKNYGSADELQLDGDPDRSALVAWDVSALPTGSTVVSASITVNVTNRAKDTYKLYEITQPWVESEATWVEYANGSPWEVAGGQGSGDAGTEVLAEYLGDSTGLLTIELNAAGIAEVQSWVDNPSENYGLFFKDYDDATSDGLRFDSREVANAANRPLLSVTYTTDSPPTENVPPVVDPATFSIPEDSADNAPVGTVTASDANVGQMLTFSITGGNTNDAFDIDPQTGEIFVSDSSQLDATGTPQYNLTVTATDDGPGNLTGSATITVDVTSVSEPNVPPVVDSATFSIPEDSADNDTVGTVTASDANAGQMLTFNITGGNTNDAFDIDPQTGEIVVNDSSQLDATGTPQYNLTVTATDDGPGNLTGSSTITVDVTSVNPGSVSSIDVRISAASDDAEERADGGLKMGSSDLELTFDKSDQVVGMRFNDIEIPRGAGIVKAYIQFQTDQENTEATTVVIQGQDIGDAPTFVDVDFNISTRDRTSASVEWSPDAWEVVGEAGPNQMTPDIAAVIQEIVNRSDWSSGNSLAIIITGTGERTAEAYEGEQDAAPLLHIDYAIDNEAPVVDSATFTLPEDSTIGTPIGTVSANDADAGQTVTFGITGGNTNNAFAIDPDTGDITVNAGLDFESTPQYSLTVTATDDGPGNLSGSATITINVTDANDAPTVSADSFSVAEDSTDGALVGTVSAGDDDSGQMLTFDITGGNTNNVFAIDPDNGEIRVNDSTQLDFNANPVYNLTVTATDDGPGNLSGSATITVFVTGPNVPPVVTSASFSVDENSSDDTVVGTVAASDDNTGQTLSFSITGGNTNAAFKIDSESGEISVNDSSQLDFNAIPVYNLTVTATDDGPGNLTGSATVTITVNEAAAATPITFRAMGDVPYSNSEYGEMLDDLANTASNDEFFIHLGDIKSGSGSCDPSIYEDVAATLLTSSLPVFIIPGDNEWNDCSTPEEAWANWEANFSNFDENWSHNFGVTRQDVRQENFAFVEDGVLFVGLNLVGGSVHDADEWAQRMVENADWLNENLASFGESVTSAVVFGHAFPDPDGGNREIFGDAFVAAAQSFEKPILYMMGDEHSWDLDNPFDGAPNITRVTVDAGVPSVRVTVTHDPNEPFLFDRSP